MECMSHLYILFIKIFQTKKKNEKQDFRTFIGNISDIIYSSDIFICAISHDLAGRVLP